MYFEQDNHTDNTTEVPFGFNQEHLISNHFKFWPWIQPHVQPEKESVTIGNWVNRDVGANEEPSNSC